MSSKTRIAYIDQIKVFLTCMVVAHHAGQAYGPTGGVWVVNDVEKTAWLGPFFFVNASYMMGLYFFISGYFMMFSIKRKTNAEFVVDRLKRLGFPLLFFTLLVFLPFNYLSSDRSMGWMAFLAYTYFEKPPIATGHLWFVASLLLYSFVYLFMLRSSSSATTIAKPFRLWYIFLYIIALSVVSGIVRIYYPIDVWRTWLIPVEVAHIPQYLSLFLLGTVFNKNGWLSYLYIKHGIAFLLLAIATYTLNEYLPMGVRDFWLTESLIESMLCVGISLFFLSFFKVYMNRNTPLITLLSANAYGIYLVHLFIVIALQKAMISLSFGANVKFILVTLFGIVLSLLLSMLLRKIRWVSAVV